ncbi:hypothetical protein [Actinoplanes sp. NPDC051411]|jgi:hypothetical protein|uniref:hypothetical protein n=1 Tax=Actinoplanes sp. NPDC051411 TaxID=3155522 RepID=UPI0034256CE7
MIAVVPGGERWRLIGRTGRGADLLASGPKTDNPASDRPQWQDAMERLRDADGDLLVTSSDDRHYRWVLLDENGRPIADCPPVHRDPVQCRDAFDTARRAADVALADHHHPMADIEELGGHDHPMADATTG